jgi:hypothetical protein
MGHTEQFKHLVVGWAFHSIGELDILNNWSG